jgi:hypothetical protein
MGQRSHSPIVLNRTVVDQVDLIQLKYPQNTVVPIVTNKDLPVTGHLQTLSHNVVSSTPRHERGSNPQL